MYSVLYLTGIFTVALNLPKFGPCCLPLCSLVCYWQGEYVRSLLNHTSNGFTLCDVPGKYERSDPLLDFYYLFFFHSFLKHRLFKYMMVACIYI